MQPSLRIARVDVSGYRLSPDDLAHLDSVHAGLRAVIRRHLPDLAASLLALPVPAPDGQCIDWYSDLTGQPSRLAALPAERRAAIKAKLDDRLASLRLLADELPKRERNSDALAQTLHAATLYPDDSHVYVVGDEPVLTLWGFTRRHDRRGVAVLAGSYSSRRRAGWIGGLALAILILAAGAIYSVWLERQQAISLAAELDTAVADECARPERLDALEMRMDRLDSERGRYPEIRQRLTEERSRCAESAGLLEEVDSAGWDCERIAKLREGLAGRDLGALALAALGGQLDDRAKACATAADAIVRLERGLGDCDLVTVLDRELGTPWPDAPPLRATRERIDSERRLCQAAQDLAADITTHRGDCETLSQLDGQLSRHEATRPPLAPIRRQLDAELTLCTKAAAYRQTLLDAQMDCARLRGLSRDMAAEDVSREPLQSIRRRLDEMMGQCETLEKFDDLEPKADGAAVSPISRSPGAPLRRVSAGVT